EDNKSPLTSEETGRARVKRAAALSNDIVTKRIKGLDDKTDDHNEYKRNRGKYRICEYGSAEKFVNAAIHFQDEVLQEWLIV
ncbi:hypothetical protein DPMN_060489, partial [Dreissena polymorpha]